MSGIVTPDSGLVTAERSTPGARILVVTNLWPHAARPNYGIFVQRQVESLVRLGAKIDVLFLHGYRSPAAYAIAAARLARLNLAATDYQVVHAHCGEALVPAVFFMRRPLVVSFCGDDLLGTRRPDGTTTTARRARRGILRRAAALADATITKSPELERQLPARLRRRNHVIPNGVDFELFAPIDRDDARRALGWPLDENVVLFAADPAVGRKRHDLAVEVCRRAAARLTDARLHVAHGTPPAEMPLLMNAASCLLLTSTAEGSPNVVKEAVACNLPVVTTPVGDVNVVLRDVTPSWIRAPDPDALADAVAEAIETDKRSNGRDAAAWLREDRIAQRVLDVYGSLGYEHP